MEGHSVEGRSLEGIVGSIAEHRERFRPQSLHVGLESQLHRADSAAQTAAAPQVQPNPVAALLATQYGLSQAMLLTEVLGKPRALRPYRPPWLKNEMR